MQVALLFHFFNQGKERELKASQVPITLFFCFRDMSSFAHSPVATCRSPTLDSDTTIRDRRQTPGAVHAQVGRTASRHPPETPGVGARRGGHDSRQHRLFFSDHRPHRTRLVRKKHRSFWASGCMHVFVSFARLASPLWLRALSIGTRRVATDNTRVHWLGSSGRVPWRALERLIRWQARARPARERSGVPGTVRAGR
jgi:hypothetical protein